MNFIYTKLLNKISQTIEKYSMIKPHDKILIALSGGSDSVFLLHVLFDLRLKYNFSVYAAHLNHSLRAEADNEENFVKILCSSLNIPCFSKKANIKNITKEYNISEETAGRNERYSFFESLKKEYNITKIATAHHLNDNAETILMHFIRGSGTNGLGGIEPIRKEIIRPLLDISKNEILECCKVMNFKFVTDSSNFEPVYMRNRLRLNLIPEIEKYNPNFSRTIAKNSVLFSEDNNFLEEYAYNVFKKYFNGSFPVKNLTDEHIAIQRRIIQIMFREKIDSAYNLPQKYIDAVLSLKKSGQSISLPSGIEAKLEYGNLYIDEPKQPQQEYEYFLDINKELFVPECNISFKVTQNDKNTAPGFTIPENTKLVIRNRRNGDIFYPIGMKGKKTLSDFFTDKKIPRNQRNLIPLLTANGQIINISGIYPDRRYYCNNSDNTNRYHLEIKKGATL